MYGCYPYRRTAGDDAVLHPAAGHHVFVDRTIAVEDIRQHGARVQRMPAYLGLGGRAADGVCGSFSQSTPDGR